MNRKLSIASLMVGGLLVVGLALYGSLAGGEAQAYTFYRTKVTLQPLRWWQRPEITYRISSVEPEETANSNIRPLVEKAFDAWVDVSCGLVPEATYAGATDALRRTAPSSLRATPDNVIVFIRSVEEWTRFERSPTWIAITQIAHDPDTGEIVDADIEINDGGYEFSYDDTPAQGEVDFLSMLTHELGHFYGLDHSTNAAATMYATYASSTERALDARTLAQDDIDGMCALYVDVPIHVDGSDDGGTCGAAGSGLGVLGSASLLLLVGWRRKSRGWG